MNISEIKAAVDAGQTVHWANEGYLVHKDTLGQYLITFLSNDSTIGLTDRSGDQLNGDETKFFISRPDLGVTIHCDECDSQNVIRESWAFWNPELQHWECTDLQDSAWCNSCEGGSKLISRPVREYRSTPGTQS